MGKLPKGNSRLLKIIYFDEVAANDYVTIKNGGQIDWTSKENKEKLVKLIAEIDAQAKAGFNFISAMKASISGSIGAGVDSKSASIMESTISNTILTDYLEFARNDSNIHQFSGGEVYAPDNLITMYKMYSSYLNVVPKDQIPIDLGELNNAILGDRGYYQMILESKETSKTVLRFNINAFKNDYRLADLSNMQLTYYGVRVGSCTQEQLSMENEFKSRKKKKKIDVSEIITGEILQQKEELFKVYDVVLAGVMSE